MSTVSTSSSVVTKPKKRKSRAPESVEDHEHPAPKKAKHHQPEPEAIIEVDRIDTTSMAEGNASTALQQMAIDHQDCRIVHGYTRLSLPPLFATDPMEGVEDMLEHLSLRYVGSLGGVLIDYSNITLLHDTARMIEECPFAVVDIEFDATVWCPKIGMRLDGKVNLFSPDHISLLRHDTFNVSIPNSYIPKSEYVFQHYPAENDPEFGAGSSDWHERTGGGQAADGTTGRDEDMVESMGRWVKRSTGERIGGKDGIVDFTVVGSI
ncbi:hypothetical protein FRB99_008095 [Tulasnella sp. 403]|nr:hypothetical protein FRB99_008095 [Tulasnella sp. 403]